MTFAVALGVTAIVATPAHAAPTDLAIAASGNADLTVGGTGQRLTFTIANRGPGDAENLTVRIDVPLGGEGVHINYGPDGCEVGRSNLRCGIDRLKRGESEQIMIRIAPPPNGGPATGDSRSGQGQARVEFGEELNPGNNAAAFNVTLRGPEAQALTSVSGTVKDSESDKPISNARVVVTDAKGNIRKTATNENGQFILRSGDTNPIAAGTIKISVGKDGYDTRTFSRTASAGASVRIPVRLTKKADPNASASAASGESEAAAVPTATGDTGSESGGGFMIWVLYLLAALLVLGGIGAIVWLFVRRKEDEDSERFGGAGPHGPPEHGPPGPHGPYGPQPIGAQGIYHDPYGQPTTMMGGAQATQVLGPAGSPTAVLGPGGMGPGGMGPGGIASAGMGAGGLDQPTSMLPRPGLDQPTSLIGRTGLDEPTQAHPGPSAADDDVYPQGREHYARGTGGPGYGDPGYGRDRYGDPGPVSPGYSQGGSGYGSGYGQGGGHGQGSGYPQDQGYGDPGPVSPGYGQGPGQSPGQGYGEQQPRRGRRSAEDRRIDWYED